MRYTVNMRKPIQFGRTLFKKQIIAEYWMPHKASGKALIICDGAPGLRTKHELGEFFARKGYWVFQFRYLGTWESLGEFLKKSPADDVDDVIEGIELGFRDVWTGTIYYIELSEVVVLGASFGGAAAVLSSLNPLVRSVVAIAPIVDWRAFTKKDFAEELRQFSEGFPGAYRCPPKNFKKLLTGNFYNPVGWASKLDGKKIFLIHAKDDTTVSYLPTKKFAKKIGATYLERAHGGHLGSSTLMEPAIWTRIQKFLTM